ncbi:MAG: phosphonatase-like hydrolase [Bacteroidetes bacterium]|nr:MAG: phosphonatase-like hydrolase [Bacteroidota bacterium]
MIQLVVLDMAGTTVDEDNVVYRTLQAAIVAGGVAVSLEEVLHWGAGKEKQQAIRDILAAVAPDQAEAAEAMYAGFRPRLRAAYETLAVKPCPGTEETFRALRAQGIHIALNTGYDRTTAEGLLGKLGWVAGRDHDLLVTASDVSRNRPHPDMIFLAMDRLGIRDAGTVAKVGDSAIDIEEGKNAGCGRSFGVTTGAQTAAQLATAQPDAILDQLPELLPWVLSSST